MLHYCKVMELSGPDSGPDSVCCELWSKFWESGCLIQTQSIPDWSLASPNGRCLLCFNYQRGWSQGWLGGTYRTTAVIPGTSLLAWDPFCWPNPENMRLGEYICLLASLMISGFLSFPPPVLVLSISHPIFQFLHLSYISRRSEFWPGPFGEGWWRWEDKNPIVIIPTLHSLRAGNNRVLIY